MRQPLTKFLFVTFVTFCLISASVIAAETNRLNVLFLISDDLRCELGCYGSKLAKTPNIDKLAADGVRFDRAYCQFPLCNPSRSSMLTSHRPTSTGILGNRGFFRDRHPDYVSLPQLFQTNGYPTLRAGKIFHGGIDDTDAWTEGGELRGAAAEANAAQLNDVLAAQLPLPATQEWGEGWGEGLFRKSSDDNPAPSALQAKLLLTPALSSIAWRRGGWPAPVSRAVSNPTPPSTREFFRSDELIFAQYQLPNNRPDRDGDAQMTQAQRSDRYLLLSGSGEGHPENAIANRTIAFMERFKDKPFFIACGFSKPHSPPTAPQRFYDQWTVDSIPLPTNFAPRPTVPEGFPRLSIRPRNADLFIGRDATPQAAKEMIRAYDASVSWMDWNIGRVIEALDRLKLREKTIIVFWGDHGYQLGERGKWSKAGSLFEQGDRLPLIVIAPGAKGNGKVCPRIVESLDIYPTLAELCGLPAPKGTEGRSVVPLLKDPGAKWDHPAFTVWSEDGRTLQGVAVRTERWRYAEFDGGKGGAMLFDEQNDPEELKNLADDPKFASVRAELSPLVQKYAAGLGEK
jgi:arylsulfatase A-like enzyme